MKKIKYQFLSAQFNKGTTENPDIEQIILDKEISCSDEYFDINYAIAEKEAYNGRITVEDVLEPVTEPNKFDQIEAQIIYTAMMTDTLLMEV